MWVRDDAYGGAGGGDCSGAAAMAADATKNDYVHQVDFTDDDAHIDLGGLVRSADIDADGEDEIFSDLELVGDIDSRVDPTLRNGTVELIGEEHESSTWTLCWADFSHANGGVPYDVSNPPPDDSHFYHAK